MNDNQFIHPYPVRYQDVDLSWMIGLTIIEISYYEPNSWHFLIGPSASLGVECLWRLVENDRIVLTSGDHGHQFGLPKPIDAVCRSQRLIVGRKITSVNLQEATADIIIKLDDNCRLEIIADSSGYESWQLCDPSETEYFAQGGGQICEWKNRA
jgi:hypothetical protein